MPKSKNTEKHRMLSLLLTLMLVCGAFPQAAFAETKSESTSIGALDNAPTSQAAEQVKAVLYETAAYLRKTVPDPTTDANGNNEWTVFALARGGYITNAYIEKYLGNLTAYVKEKKGVLSASKYTEYSRVVIALLAIGVNARNIGGYNLLAPLAEYENVIKQGVNGPTFALIAFDAGHLEVPTLPAGTAHIQTTRENLIAYLLEKQFANGGWSVTGTGAADPDMTAMVVQALAPYAGENPDVKVAVDNALICLSNMQNSTTAGFTIGGSEADGQVLITLNVLGIPITDDRFVKNGKSVYDDLMTHYISESGAFKHLPTGLANGMATEKAMATLVSMYRNLTGAKALYDMSDVPAYTYTEPEKKETDTTAPKVSKTSVKKLKAGKKSFSVTWKKNSKATGYEVMYSTDKKFKKNVKRKSIGKNSTVKFTAKSLKAKKTYYVKIRSCLKVGKTKFYSNWSARKKIKTKA